MSQQTSRYLFQATIQTPDTTLVQICYNFWTWIWWHNKTFLFPETVSDTEQYNNAYNTNILWHNITFFLSRVYKHNELNHDNRRSTDDIWWTWQQFFWKTAAQKKKISNSIERDTHAKALKKPKAPFYTTQTPNDDPTTIINEKKREEEKLLSWTGNISLNFWKKDTRC